MLLTQTLLAALPANASETELVAVDGGPGDLFGTSVAIDGSTIVIGAPIHDVNGITAAGQVYVYVDNGTTWTLQATLVASDPVTSAFFGTSVAISENTVVVANGQPFGQVYVYVRNGSAWTQQAILPGGGCAYFQGCSNVAISGDTIVVGDPIAGASGAGEAYVHVRTGTTWTQQATLLPSDGVNQDEFGTAVAIDGDTIVVGALHHRFGALGQAYVYVRTGSTWAQQVILTASDSQTGDDFGAAVAIKSNKVVVGAWGHQVSGIPVAGQVYTFVRSGATWSQKAILAANDPGQNFEFGNSVAISESQDVVVVGAHWSVTNGIPYAGQAYVYVWDGSAWSLHAKLAASDAGTGDTFGTSVAISAGVVVVGAPNHTTSGKPSAGAAYVFGLDVPPPDSVTIVPRGDLILSYSTGSVSLEAPGFSLTSSTLAGEGILGLLVGPILPGGTMSLVARWSGGDLPGSFTIGGVTYLMGCSFFPLPGCDATASIDFEGTAVAPPFTPTGTATVRASFTFSGNVSYLDAAGMIVTDLLTGVGIATIHLVEITEGSPKPVWQYTHADYHLRPHWRRCPERC